jgi:hypothetical protein
VDSRRPLAVVVYVVEDVIGDRVRCWETSLDDVAVAGARLEASRQ